MRKQSVTVRCDGDGCQTIADVDNLNETPAGWYRVVKATEDLKTPMGTATGWDFHSLKCVERWAKARRVTLNGDGEGVRHAKTIRCPVDGCGQMFAPQGFRFHWEGSHAELGLAPSLDGLRVAL